MKLTRSTVVILSSPAIGLMLIVFLWPFISVLYLSVSNKNLVNQGIPVEIVGLCNFIRGLTSTEFQLSFVRTSRFALLALCSEIVLAMLVAEFILQTPTGRRLVRPVALLPALLPGIVIGLYWKLLLQGEFGFLSYWLSYFGLEFGKGILSSSELAPAAIVCVDIWQWTLPLAVVFTLSRARVPKQLVEACVLDGAGRLRLFFNVRLPYMLPTVVGMSALRLVDLSNDYDKTSVLTGGGPGRVTEFTSLFIYRESFQQWQSELG